MEVETFNIIGTIILLLIIIVAGVLLVTAFGLDVKKTIPNQIKLIGERLISVIPSGGIFNPCSSYNGTQISYEDLKNIVDSTYKGRCGASITVVSITFNLNKGDIISLAKSLGIAQDGELVFFNSSINFGVGGIVVQGNAGKTTIFRVTDTINIFSKGEPVPDTFLNLSQKGCDPYDNVCDAACIYKGICDSACDDGSKHNIACNLACIDQNKNKKVDLIDANIRISGGICNPDCYTNASNSFKAYDPQCVNKFKNQFDDVCDPNSNGVVDGVCDPDCTKSKKICDLDCNGIVSAGNPKGLYDAKCFICDHACNGVCSPACKNDETGDPDCDVEKGLLDYCEGDEVCSSNKGENCENSKDCSSICNDQNFICAVKDPSSDQAGCTSRFNLNEGDLCYIKGQCATSLQCDNTGHCCSEGKEWNGTGCQFRKTYKILFVPLNFGSSTSEDQFKSMAKQVFDKWVGLSPFKECSDPATHVEALVLSPDKCQERCSSNDCESVARNCAKRSEFGNKYNIISGLCSGQSCFTGTACGVAFGIPSEISVSNMGACGSLTGIDVGSHEMGHSFGLCHIPNCGGTEPNWANIMYPDQVPFCGNFGDECAAVYVMDYFPPMGQYANHAYTFLRDKVFGPMGQNYLQGCGK